MKKILAITMAAVIVFALFTGCSRGKTQPETSTSPAATEKANPTETEKATEPATTAEPVASTAAPTSAPTEAPTETPAPTEALEPKALTHGTVEGNTYVNESLNFKFTVPDDWTFYSKEQIVQQNNIAVEMFDGTSIADMIGASGQMLDMMAFGPDNSNVNLIIQPAQAIMAAFTDRQLFEMLEDSYKIQFQSAGMEIKEYEVIDVPSLGEDSVALRMLLVMSGIEMTEYQIWLRDNPDYCGVFTVTTLGKTETTSLLDGVSSVN